MDNPGNKIIRIIVILVIAAIAVGVAGLILYDRQQSREEARQAKEKAWSESDQYNRRVYEIDNELRDLQNGENEKEEHMGTVNFLFETPDARMDEEAYDQISEAGYQPMIAVSEDAFPGKTGMLTLTRLKQLCDEGCSLAVTAASREEVTKLCEKLEKAGLPKPQAVFIESGKDETLEKAAVKNDIHTVVCLKEITEIKDTKQFLPMSATNLNSTNRSTFRKNATDDRNTCVYAVGFEGGSRQYDKDRMQELIDFLSDYLKDGSIKLMTPDEAYEYYKEVAEAIASSDAEKQKRIDELEAEKKELFKKMS